jgi:DNA polymerase III epsilon subunit-like protein
MHLSTPILKLPKLSGTSPNAPHAERDSNGYKSPSLKEAYTYFHPDHEELQNAHDALADAEACLCVFQGLVKMCAIQLENCGRMDDSTLSPLFENNVVDDDDDGKSTRLQDKEKTSSSSSSSSGGLEIDVKQNGFAVSGPQTYRYKETFKKWGARWQWNRKTWVFDNTEMLEPVKRLTGISLE